MCFSACMIDGYCERNLSGKATKVSEDGKVLTWGKGTRAFKGDAEWQYNANGKLILIEHHIKHGYVKKYVAEQNKRGVVTRKYYYELTTLGRKEARGLYYENHAGLAA